MWMTCLLLSIGWLLFVVLTSLSASNSKVAKNHNFNLFNALFAGVFVSAVLMFFPVHNDAAIVNGWGVGRTLLLSLFNSMQIFAIGCEFQVVREGMLTCPESLVLFYEVWAAVLFVLAPVFTFGFVLSLFKNLSAYARYLGVYFKDVYVFSELNDQSFALACDIKSRNKRAAVVFTDVFETDEEKTYELTSEAEKRGFICFKKDLLAINFVRHSKRRALYFFAIGLDETENLNHSLKLIEQYNKRENTHIYVFSKKMESELLLASVDRGTLKVRRINEVRSLINRILYERGEIIFEGAREGADGEKHISAVVVGMGCHGTEMVKALTWFSQMDGYTVEINAFDMDPLARERFVMRAPELMSPDYNGVFVAGEAQYKIEVHPGLDVESQSFLKAINKITDATYVMVALGNDDINIETAVNLRVCFERMGIHPTIQAIVYNSQQKNALQGLKNYRGQTYDIEFIGDIDSSYTEDVIIDSELEEDALRRHLKWGKEEDFWTYEYNYRSSAASAIHMRARIKCGIAGAEKREDELTLAERDALEVLEHRRWNAYMRAEGYIYSGSKAEESRNDLAKMHNDLVDYASLSEEEKRKDSRVGSK